MPNSPRPSSTPALHTRRADEFDYIVVGAGSAGCVVANRLSEDADVSVLLMDAGGPEAIPKLDEFELMGSRFDWKYQTEPEPQLNNRRINWPRGKMFGGSSSMSSMVYLRGNQRDYDHWNYLGNEGWAYRDALRCFKRSESNGSFHDEFHGSDGPLSVESVSDNSELKNAFFRASEACGFKSDPNWDFNGARQEGVAGLYQKTLKGGERFSAGDAFLLPVIDRPNLIVRPFCLATGLVWEGNRVAGVGYLPVNQNFASSAAQGQSWNLRVVRAAREVIVCAGTVDSPHLLMLSGIGPAEQLRRHAIPVRMDLPGVGQNLQDHLNIVQIYQPTAAAGKVLDRIGTNGLLVRSREGMQSASPDLQLLAFEVVVAAEGSGFAPGPLYFCTACLVRPQSSGTISLHSADPTAAPVIRANYLQCDHDLEALTEGVRIVQSLTSSSAYSTLLDSSQMVSVPASRSIDDVRSFIRQGATTTFHPVGTCRMGHDAKAVVDNRLRVHGVEGLRVADASIMPSITNTNTNAPTIMIGERAAEMIKSI